MTFEEAAEVARNESPIVYATMQYGDINSVVRGEILENLMYHNSSLYGDDVGYVPAKDDTYMSRGLFEAQSVGFQEINTKDSDLSAPSYASSHGFLDRWGAFGLWYAIAGEESDPAVNIAAENKIVRVTHDVLNNPDKYYYASLHQSDLAKCYDQAMKTDSSTYLVHFNVSDYFEKPCVWEGDIRAIFFMN